MPLDPRPQPQSRQDQTGTHGLGPTVLDTVEQIASQADPRLQPQRSVAFSLLTPTAEALGIAVELAPSCDTTAVTDLPERLRHRVQTETSADLALVMVLSPGQLPCPPLSLGTRGTIRLAVLLGTLSEVACWLGNGLSRADLRCPVEMPATTMPVTPPNASGQTTAVPRPRTARGLERWIRGRLEDIKVLPPAAADTAVTLQDLGFDSLAQLQLVRDLERHCGITIPPTAPWETGTIANLASFAFDLSQKAIQKNSVPQEAL